MARIQVWFTKACEGELHGDDQPFDPFFLYDGSHEIILSQDATRAINAKGKLSIWAAELPPRFLVVTGAQEEDDVKQQLHLHVLHVDVAPGAMRRIRKAPATLGHLTGLLAERNVNLLVSLKQSILEWHATAKMDDGGRWLTCILVTMPQVHPRTSQIGASRPMAFLCAADPGRIGEALGVLGRLPPDARAAARYMPMMLSDMTPDRLNDFHIQVAPVHVEMDAAGASGLAGKRTDVRELVMIGAGSLGSHLAEYLSREGLFRWTVVDDDMFLPHNVARHTLASNHFGQGKARNIASRLTLIRRDTAAQAIQENVLHDKPSDSLVQALQRAEIIIDASASVPVSRWLSDASYAARRVSAFFTPNGRSAVLMAEAADRSVTLRDLEAEYLREILTNPTLRDHLRLGQQMRYTGACRALTNQIPASSIAVLSGLLAAGIAESTGNDTAALRIWTIREDGSVDCVNPQTSLIKSFTSGWSITIPAALHHDLVARRERALPSETGGPLVGVIDHEAKHLAAIHALATPPDSVGTRSDFVRGKRRLQRFIEEAQYQSGGQVRYIGEWHSHPTGVLPSPSPTDIRQIRQLSTVLDLDGLPALSLIVGEQGGMAILLGEVA